MRITADKIQSVKEFSFNGTIYQYLVQLKNGTERDARYYGESPRKIDGRISVKKYNGADMPKALETFLRFHKCEDFAENVYSEDEVFRIDIYRAENPRIILK